MSTDEPPYLTAEHSRASEERTPCTRQAVASFLNSREALLQRRTERCQIGIEAEVALAARGTTQLNPGVRPTTTTE
jgi:hypothetical protein